MQSAISCDGYHHDRPDCVPCVRAPGPRGAIKVGTDTDTDARAQSRAFSFVDGPVLAIIRAVAGIMRNPHHGCPDAGSPAHGPLCVPACKLVVTGELRERSYVCDLGAVWSFATRKGHYHSLLVQKCVAPLIKNGSYVNES